MCGPSVSTHYHRCPKCNEDFEVEIEDRLSEEQANAAHPDECPECGVKFKWDHETHTVEVAPDVPATV